MRRLMTFDSGPTAYHLSISRAHPNVLTGGSRGRVKKTADYLDNAEIVKNRDRGKIAVHGEYRGIPVTIFSTGEGTGSVSCTLPEVIEGCKYDDMNIIRIGTSGGLQKDLAIGDFVVTTEVIKRESTSDTVIELLQYLRKKYQHGETLDHPVMHRLQSIYNSPEEFAQRMDATIGSQAQLEQDGYRPSTDKKVRDAIVSSAIKNSLSFQGVHIGPTKVVAEIYCDIILSKEADHGDALAVSMEISAICAYRDFYNLVDDRNIQVGNLLMISDNVKAEAGKTDMTQFLEHKEAMEEAHIKAGLEALLALRTQQA